MNYSVIIPAAGVGKRMRAGKNKQLLELAGKPLLMHTLQVFENDACCGGIVLVINPTEEKEIHALLARFAINKVRHIVAGGPERQDSVYEGLKACGDQDFALVHDGARPFVAKRIIHRLVERAAEVGAAVPAIPVNDTIKRVEDGKVRQTLERSSLWSVQTPQAFRLWLARDIHEKAKMSGFRGTDDASLAEHFGHEVAVVESGAENIKITTPYDLVMARSILERREEEK